jgi:hypothetical protein
LFEGCVRKTFLDALAKTRDGFGQAEQFFLPIGLCIKRTGLSVQPSDTLF